MFFNRSGCSLRVENAEWLKMMVLFGCQYGVDNRQMINRGRVKSDQEFRFNLNSGSADLTLPQ